MLHGPRLAPMRLARGARDGGRVWTTSTLCAGILCRVLLRQILVLLAKESNEGIAKCSPCESELI